MWFTGDCGALSSAMTHRGWLHPLLRRCATSSPSCKRWGDVKELREIPGWKAHQLSGERKGTWSLTVTRNWRLTFKVAHIEGEIFDLNFEDYH